VWYALSWIFRRRMPQTKWFLRAAAVAGPAAVITLEAGWVVTEVGRQPWIVYNLMKVETRSPRIPGYGSCSSPS
jgi:cytochrome d ubiquinol oxidase subunit I